MVENFEHFKSRNELNNEGILKEKLFEFFKDSKITVEDTSSRKGRNSDERFSEGNIKRCTVNEYLSKYDDLLTFSSGIIDAKNIVTELFLEKIIKLVNSKTREKNSEIYYKYKIKKFDDLEYELYEIFDKETNKKLTISSPLHKDGNFCIKLEKSIDDKTTATTENKIFIDNEKGGCAVFVILEHLLSAIKFNFEFDSMSFGNSYTKIFNKKSAIKNDKKYNNIKNTFEEILLIKISDKKDSKFENVKNFINILFDRNLDKNEDNIRNYVTNDKPDIISEINNYFNFIKENYRDNRDFIEFFEQYIENLLSFVLYYRDLLSKKYKNIKEHFEKNGLKYDLTSDSPVKRNFTYNDNKQAKFRVNLFNNNDETIGTDNLTGKQHELKELPSCLIEEFSKFTSNWNCNNVSNNTSIVDQINDIFKNFIDYLVNNYTKILENKNLLATKGETEFLIKTTKLLINNVQNIKENEFKLFGINYKNCGTSICESINKNVKTLKRVCNLIEEIIINKNILNDIPDKEDNEYDTKLKKAAFSLTYNFYTKEATLKEIKNNAIAVKIFIENKELFESTEIKERLESKEFDKFSYITKNLLSNIIRYLPNVKRGSNTEQNFKEFIACNVNEINKQEIIKLLQNKLIKPSELFKYCNNNNQNKIVIEKFFINGNAGFVDNHDVLYDMLKNFDNSKYLEESLKLYKIGDFTVRSTKNKETGFYKYNIEYKNKNTSYNDTKVYDYLKQRVLGNKKYMDDLFDICTQKESGISSGFKPDHDLTEKTDIITKTEIIDNNNNKLQDNNNSVKFLKDYKKGSNKNATTSSLSYLFESSLKNKNEQEDIIKKTIKKKYDFKDNENIDFNTIQDTIIESINFSDLPEEFLNNKNYSKKIIAENNKDNEWETLKLKEYPEIKIKISKTKFNNNDNELFNVVEIIENLRNEYDFIKAISNKYIYEFYDSKMDKKLDFFSEETYKNDRYTDFLFNKLEVESDTIKSIYGIDAEKYIKKSITKSNENTYKNLTKANNDMDINKSLRSID